MRRGVVWGLVVLVLVVAGGVVGKQQWERVQEEKDRARAVASQRRADVVVFREAVAFAEVNMEPAAQRSGAEAKAACDSAALRAKAVRISLLARAGDEASGERWMPAYLMALETALLGYGEFAAKSDAVEGYRAAVNAMSQIMKENGQAYAVALFNEHAGEAVQKAQAAAKERDLAQGEFSGALKRLLQALADPRRPAWVPAEALLQRDMLLRRAEAAGVQVSFAEGAGG